MSFETMIPWLVLSVYCVIILRMTPKSVSPKQFFGGAAKDGGEPSLWLLVASAAITWIFAKSIANAANLAGAFGIAGGIGYAFYYLSFLVAGGAIYLIRVKGGHTSLAGFLTSKYGATCARLFLIAIAIRLFNEVWSNTKVASLYFGARGGTGHRFHGLLFMARGIAVFNPDRWRSNDLGRHSFGDDPGRHLAGTGCAGLA
ncbi:MAG: hypothetical protein ACKVJQ_07365 [Alphaproteobacteria bacterium]